MGKKKKRALAHEGKREPSTEPGTAAQAIAQPAAAVRAAPSTSRGSDAAMAERTGEAVSPLRRTLENAFIACFLAFMLGMPLRYYLGGRGFDERFSWRMFSTIRMLDCKAAVEETLAGGGERPVNLGKEVQVAWVGLLERGRELVIDKLLARRCAQPDVTEARYSLSCVSTDGSRLPEVKRQRACAAKAVAP
jgi:hypothetical protein